MNSDEIRGHEKEILTKRNIVIDMLYLLFNAKCCMTIFCLDKTKEILIISLQSGNSRCRYIQILIAAQR